MLRRVSTLGRRRLARAVSVLERVELIGRLSSRGRVAPLTPVPVTVPATVPVPVGHAREPTVRRAAVRCASVPVAASAVAIPAPAPVPLSRTLAVLLAVGLLLAVLLAVGLLLAVLLAVGLLLAVLLA
ncbi:hypothetical protein ACIQ9R_36510, partial [Streptomyces sp. NPDC094447]